MSKQEYNFHSDQIDLNTEESSAVSLISYEIENANYHNLDKESIKNEILNLKK